MPVDLNRLVALGLAPELGSAIKAELDALGFGDTNDSVNEAVSAAGTDQAGATILTSDTNIITSASASLRGVRLPTYLTKPNIIGDTCTIRNTTLFPVDVYPASGGQINDLGADVPIVLGPGRWCQIRTATSTKSYAMGQEISSAFEQWYHYRTVYANASSLAAIHTISLAQQESVSIQGYFRGAYVGKATAALGLQGRFQGAAYRNSGGVATISGEMRQFSNADTDVATNTLVAGTPAVARTAIGLAGTTAGVALTTGIHDTCSNIAPASTPLVRLQLSGSDVIVASRGVSTDTVVVYTSFSVVRFAGQ